uniref:Uncharacterized protein n=1 Tax=Anopheles coluzzii TaxID=1518534 RepID=A0A8W7P0Y4_ANOCL
MSAAQHRTDVATISTESPTDHSLRSFTPVRFHGKADEYNIGERWNTLHKCCKRSLESDQDTRNPNHKDTYPSSENDNDGVSSLRKRAAPWERLANGLLAVEVT